MKNLAIDTSSSICSVAVLENDILIDEINLNDGRTHSENLMPLMEELLKRNSLDIKNIEMISCCTGPGSFTGIRIGVATIKPISEVLNIKIASVTSLEILAKNVENAETIVSLIDARNNQVYCGIFDKEYNTDQSYDKISNIFSANGSKTYIDNSKDVKELLDEYSDTLDFIKHLAVIHLDYKDGSLMGIISSSIKSDFPEEKEATETTDINEKDLDDDDAR